MTCKSAFIYSDALLSYHFNEDHPFNQKRVLLTKELLEDSKMLSNKDVIEPTAEIINHHELDIIKLSRVLIPEVKSVLSVKTTTAHQHKIDVMIDIPEAIESIPLSMVDFIRMISILLDNAIEAAVLSHEKKLHIALFELGQCLYFIVRNSSEETAIDLQEIFNKSYSSKNDGRGYGLFSLKRLVEKQENVSLETSFTAPYFTQTLIMKRQ